MSSSSRIEIGTLRGGSTASACRLAMRAGSVSPLGRSGPETRVVCFLLIAPRRSGRDDPHDAIAIGPDHRRESRPDPARADLSGLAGMLRGECEVWIIEDRDRIAKIDAMLLQIADSL